MKTLYKNGKVINVFTMSVEEAHVLVEDDTIIGVGTYYEEQDADVTVDVSGKYICPGFIDSHIHIESTMLTPSNLARECLKRGTTSIVADPHEIANVCGTDGIRYMLEKSDNLPLNVYIMLPSCVPATPFDESGAVLDAASLKEFYKEKRVLGLAEMMNYPGVLAEDEDILKKINDSKSYNKTVDGHAPLLMGKPLDRYISKGVQSDHECYILEEAMTRVAKGQWIMIREGSAAKNLESLIELFEDPYYQRCTLATDDCNPADLVRDGHIDKSIKIALSHGKSVIRAIRMASLNAATCFKMNNLGAIAPGYRADFLILNNLETMDIRDVYSKGVKVVSDKEVLPFEEPKVDSIVEEKILNSMNLDEIKPGELHIEEKSTKCRVIKIVPGQIITDEDIVDIDWSNNNGIDVERDILKLAVIERHKNTGHKGIGFIEGIGLKSGALGATVSHDSHNLIVIGTNDEDMITVANHIRNMGGGMAVAKDGEIIADMKLPIAGLMTDVSAEEAAKENVKLRNLVYDLGVPKDVEPFMNMAFVSLPVIPSLKMSTTGLIDVTKFSPVSLYVE